MYWHFVTHELKISLRGYCLKTSRVAGAPRRSRELLGGGHRFFDGVHRIEWEMLIRILE